MNRAFEVEGERIIRHRDGNYVGGPLHAVAGVNEMHQQTQL